MKVKIDLIMVAAGCQGPGDKNHIPLGLLYIGTALEKHGFDIKIWHLLPEEFVNALPGIKERNPLWVGISVLSGMTTYYAAQLSKSIRKEVPSTKIVWGGHHPSALPEECLGEDYIDFVVCGEGEDIAVEFTDAMIGNKSINTIQGLGWKDINGKPIVNNSRALEEDLDKYEINWELVNVRDYLHRNAFGKLPLGFYSSRGCPYKCTFCATPYYTGTSFRYHSPEFVERNLEYLNKTYGVNSVFFSDDNFMIRKQRGLEIIERLDRKGVSVDTVDVRLNQLNEKVLAEFNKHKVQGIFFGYESGNDRILTLMKKGVNLDHAMEKVKLINSFGIRCWASGIIGTPTETREEFYQTIDYSMWLRDNLPEGSTVSTYRYMPIPKTYLLQLAIQEGFEYPKSTEDWKKIDPIGPYYSMKSWTKWLTEEDEKYFALVQELGRSKMLNYSRNRSWPINTVNNYFVSRLRRRIKSRDLRMDWNVKAFDKLRNAYSILVYGKQLGIRSQAVDF